jgi:hypothetical protein
MPDEPIELCERRLTRRRAMAGALAAGAGLLLTRFSSAVTTQPADGVFRFALITDTHLGRGGEAPSEQMAKAVEEINAANVELVICCGDLVNSGETAANEKRYPEWMKIAEKWKSPWHAVPGNHDPVALFTKHILPQTDYVIDRPRWRFICFRDAKPNPEHQGAVLDDQLTWIQSQIDEAAKQDRRVFLVSHIIYHDNKNPDVGWMIKDNRDAFGALLERNNKTIAAFFAGHFHSGLRGWDDTFGIHEVVLPSACWNFKGTRLHGAPGYTYDEDRPAWMLAEVTNDALTLHYKPIGADITVIRELKL